MKLRIEDNTLRLRLSAEDVRRFGQTGRVAVTVKLGPRPADELTYSLEHAPNPEADAVRVLFTGGTLNVLVPRTMAAEWVDSDQIGFSETLNVTENQELRILVEKDLDCSH
ncbi:hypothetical protein SAMN00120144_3852 [Hymenobacter roseosalivarius DSM 11622]|uniref:Uncharacterized protein n=1 Tax=Hymenobacter roseosalivarius DSM 11622 TaxID=645990 RepID=A0A1W1UUB8_9BACT|nr:hypothetical protein [Hymenobacter roseosalivarius]SMB84748.1 hypothetical protein SAMN00120144_3852 [Hymenobacter roseosalivarius DSM 11622]